MFNGIRHPSNIDILKEGLKDWQNLLDETRFRYIKVLFVVFFLLLFITGVKKFVHYTDDLAKWGFVISRIHCIHFY